MSPRQSSELFSFSVLKWFRFQLHFPIHQVDPESDGVDLVFRPNHLALLLYHGRELLERDGRQLTELVVLLLDLSVQPLELFTVRASRHRYIRITRFRRYGGADSFRFGGTRRGVRRGAHGGLAAAEVEGAFFTLAHPAAPQLAELIEAAGQGAEAEAPRVVAHLLLVELVDVDLEVLPFLRRRNFADPGEELVVLVLQDPNVFFELLELFVAAEFGHALLRLQYALGSAMSVVVGTSRCSFRAGGAAARKPLADDPP